MKILIVLPWDQEFGGVASVVGNLGRFLEKKGHDILFFHPGSENLLKKRVTKWGFTGFRLRLRVPVVKGHSIKSFMGFVTFLPLTLIQILYLLVLHRIDVINVHFAGGEFFHLAIFKKILGIKLVTSIHGGDIFPGGKSPGWLSPGLRLLLLFSDSIIAPSKAFLDEFLRLVPVLRDKGAFIHNGIDMSEMKQVCQGNGDDPGVKYVLCIAAQNEKKGIDILLEALSMLKADHEFVRLWVVGDGPLRRRHEALCVDFGIEDRVRFLGDRGRADIVKLIHGCEVLVLPSRSEPFGIVIIEAMACRKAVIATAVGGIPDHHQM